MLVSLSCGTVPLQNSVISFKNRNRHFTCTGMTCFKKLTRRLINVYQCLLFVCSQISSMWGNIDFSCKIRLIRRESTNVFKFPAVNLKDIRQLSPTIGYVPNGRLFSVCICYLTIIQINQSLPSLYDRYFVNH